MKEMHCPYCNSVITSDKYREVISKIREEEKEKAKLLRTKMETEMKEHYEKHFAKQMEEINIAKKSINEQKKSLLDKEKELKKTLSIEMKEKYEKRMAFEKDILKKKYTELEKLKANMKRQEKELHESIEQKMKLKYDNRIQHERTLLEKGELKLQEQQKEFKNKYEELQKMTKDLKQKENEIKASISKELELKYDDKLKKEQEKISIERKRLEDKEYKLKAQQQEIVSAYHKRQESLEKTVEKQNNLIEDLKKEADRRSLSELGDIPEERLKDILQKEFPEDNFDRFGKGRAGGDVIQTIILNNNPVSKILYENKNERGWKYKWIEKIKKDRIEIGTTYAILVSKDFPRNEKHFAIIKGIPVVSPRLLPHISRIIRTSIIVVEQQKLSAFEKEEKVSLLYTYLNSNEFKSNVTAVGESIEKLNKLRQDERNQHFKNWTQEEHEVNNISEKFTKIVSKVETVIESDVKQPVVKKKKKVEVTIN